MSKGSKGRGKRVHFDDDPLAKQFDSMSKDTVAVAESYPIDFVSYKEMECLIGSGALQVDELSSALDVTSGHVTDRLHDMSSLSDALEKIERDVKRMCLKKEEAQDAMDMVAVEIQLLEQSSTERGSVKSKELSKLNDKLNELDVVRGGLVSNLEALYSTLHSNIKVNPGDDLCKINHSDIAGVMKEIKGDRDEYTKLLTHINGLLGKLKTVLANKAAEAYNSLRYTDRLSTFLVLASGAVNIPGCDLSKLFRESTVKILTTAEKNSVSPTGIILGDLNTTVDPDAESFALDRFSQDPDRKAVVKYFFTVKDPSPPVYSSRTLGFEVEVYEKVISKMFLEKHTPNVMLYLASFKCPDFFEAFMTKMGIDLHELHGDIQIEQYSGGGVDEIMDVVNTFVDTHINPAATEVEKKLTRTLLSVYYAGSEDSYGDPFAVEKELNVLIIEMGRGLSLGDMLAKLPSKKLPIGDERRMLFQVFYTVAVFEAYGLRHNDLHPGNIFIDTTKRTLPTVYFTTETTYHVINTDGMYVKLYDFDHGTTAPGIARDLVGKNEEASFQWKNHKIDNVSNPRFDPKVVCGIATWGNCSKACETMCDKIRPALGMLKDPYFKTLHRSLAKDGYDKMFSPAGVKDGVAYSEVFIPPWVDRQKVIANIKKAKDVKFV